MAEKTKKSNKATYNNLFSSLISDIKSYSGQDPLLPWLRGIKKMKESLPPPILNEKLPRFLQKCTQSFESDRDYRNDLRYIRVWLQLMDFVADPKVLLKNMEVNCIGTKQALFYQAYALYYEKIKKFEEAEKMYDLGIQNLAEPMDELQKSHEQFLARLERQKKKRILREERKCGKRPLQCLEAKENCENTPHLGEALPVKDMRCMKMFEANCSSLRPLMESNHNRAPENLSQSKLNTVSSMKKVFEKSGSKSTFSKRRPMETDSNKPRFNGNDDTTMVAFVDTAIIGKSEAEDACHHGLVDPTINMKEAMNAINSMFREPIETAPIMGRSLRKPQKEDQIMKNEFNVFVEENQHNETNSYAYIKEKSRHSRTFSSRPQDEPFQIYVDDDEDRNGEDGSGENDVQNSADRDVSSALHPKAFVFPNPQDLPSDNSDEAVADGSCRPRLREDTVVHRFVGATILDELEVENVCHHGLVDPTVNLKEAMVDINGMFGEPIEFVRAGRKRADKPPSLRQDDGGFSILADDEPENKHGQKPSSRTSDSDLSEPTLCTKEAMDEINKMFGMPLDF